MDTDEVLCDWPTGACGSDLEDDEHDIGEAYYGWLADRHGYKDDEEQNVVGIMAKAQDVSPAGEPWTCFLEVLDLQQLAAASNKYEIITYSIS